MEGLTLTGDAGVGHAPAPVPEAFTVTFADVEPSVMVSVPLENAAEGLVRRTVTIFPLTVAARLPLLEATL